MQYLIVYTNPKGDRETYDTAYEPRAVSQALDRCLKEKGNAAQPRAVRADLLPVEDA